MQIHYQTIGKLNLIQFLEVHLLKENRVYVDSQEQLVDQWQIYQLLKIKIKLKLSLLMAELPITKERNHLKS